MHDEDLVQPAQGEHSTLLLERRVDLDVAATRPCAPKYCDEDAESDAVNEFACCEIDLEARPSVIDDGQRSASEIGSGGDVEVTNNVHDRGITGIVDPRREVHRWQFRAVSARAGACGAGPRR